MSTKLVDGNEPYISIVTAVCNGESFLSECIDSVLAQTFQNWDQIIVDNCSEDRSLCIARSYEAQDDRIRVFVNEEKLEPIQNWNYALGLISPDSLYCKVLFADDWLFPDCISAMVAVAVESESIGIVGTYRLNDKYVDLDGLKYPSTKTSGLEIGRLCLSRKPLWLFGSPSSLLYRADLVRGRDRFYDESLIHSDTDVCFDLLQHCDYGFEHQDLSSTRRHKESISSSIEEYGTRRVEGFVILRRYGSVFLDDREYAQRIEEKLNRYHAYLVQRLFNPRPPDFWQHYRDKMREHNIPVRWMSFLKLFTREIVCHLMPVNCD